MRLISANVLSTAEVRSPAGEDIGKVVDFMLDTEQGSVSYAVLAIGGVLGVGAKMLAIPPKALAFDSAQRCLNVGLETAALQQAPGFDRANPPDDADAVLSAQARQPRTMPSNQRNVR